MKLGLKKLIWMICYIVPMMFIMSACAENEEVQEEVVIAEPRVYLDGYEVVLEDTSITTADGKTLSLGADETYTPVAVTKEQLEERIAELKEKYPNFSDRGLAALLVANASYMEPEVFTEYVETYFGDSYKLMMRCREYQEEKYNRFMENRSNNYRFGEYDSLIKLDELYFDEYLIANAFTWEKCIADAIYKSSEEIEDLEGFIFVYDYLTYREVDELVFMHGEPRVEGNGLIFQEYVIDVMIAILMSCYYDDRTPPQIEYFEGENSTYFYDISFEVSERRFYYRTELERLLVDEVNLVLNTYYSEMEEVDER